MADESAPLKKHVVIMDEVDGMSGGDRGGMQQLVLLLKQTQIPIICICNDRASQKVKTLGNYCLDLKFRRPDAATIKKRVSDIAAAEGLELKANTLEQLVSSTQSDIRQILTLLSTYRISQDVLDYDGAKSMGAGAKKHTILSPFEIVPRFFATAGAGTLNDRIDLYFMDYGMVPLMVQEMYIKSKLNLPPTTAPGKSRAELIGLQRLSDAAESISDADLFENKIRREQDWGLLPVHGVLSCIRPGYIARGSVGFVQFTTCVPVSCLAVRDADRMLRLGGLGKTRSSRS